MIERFAEKKGTKIMYRMRGIFSFGLCILILAAFFGCAVQDGNIYTPPGAGTNSGAAYHPKLPPGIETLDMAKKDLADLLKPQNRFFYIKYDGGVNISPNYTQFKEIQEFYNPDKNFWALPSNQAKFEFANQYTLSAIRTQFMPLDQDRIKVPFAYFSYEDLLDCSLVVEYRQDLYTSYPYMIKLPRKISFHFQGKNLEDVQRLADDLYFIQQHLLQQRNEKLASFEAQAAKYRALTIRPAVSEEQRKYIVQANALSEQKAYGSAIDLYLKAVELDPVSYPGAYFNLALLSAQVKRFNPAISYMKQYLMLEPEAKDARSAQDKIYEWELMIQKKQQ
jgi:tetratricopeptide (TPR) repeat protein